MSFLDLALNYKEFLKKGYNKTFLTQNFYSMLSLPFFLFTMTALAAILTLNTLRKSNNLKFTVIGLLISALIFYLKDLSVALGQTDRIPLILAVWALFLALSLFIFIRFYRSMKNKIIFIVFFSLIANKLFADNLLIEATDIILDKNKETSVFKNNVK